MDKAQIASMSNLRLLTLFLLPDRKACDIAPHDLRKRLLDRKIRR